MSSRADVRAGRSIKRTVAKSPPTVSKKSFLRPSLCTVFWFAIAAMFAGLFGWAYTETSCTMTNGMQWEEVDPNDLPSRIAFFIDPDTEQLVANPNYDGTASKCHNTIYAGLTRNNFVYQTRRRLQSANQTASGSGLPVIGDPDAWSNEWFGL